MKLKRILITVFGLITGILSIFLVQNPVFAQTVFTDDFSNGLEKWQDSRNRFDLWSIVSGKADAYINTYSTATELIPKDEYWHDSWKNYIFKFDYIYFEGRDINLSFWYQDLLNRYQIHFFSGNYILSHVKNGFEVFRGAGKMNLLHITPMKMELHLENGKIQLYMNKKLMFEHFDPTFDNDHGKIGLLVTTGAFYPTHVQFDNLEVILIPDLLDLILPMNQLKQTDPAWSNIEYNSAKQWSAESYGIGDWGCLLTSINMLLNYYEITNLPSGEIITPLTLNEWLKNESDGFVGPGLVNWPAISRLVKQIHDNSGTVNLEYSRIAGDNLQTAMTEIQNKQPVILEIPGHFFVGSGVTASDNDIFISDPAYDYQVLNQHQTSIISTRILTPSNTDLSFINLAHDTSIQVDFTNELGDVPENYQRYKQSLTGFVSQTQSPEYNLHEISKPISGNYQIKITSNSNLPQYFKITIFTYDIDANLSNLTYEGVAGSQKIPLF
jgi:hypothetical protein